LAADAMVYVADLAPMLREVARVLTPGGLFAFTVETHESKDRGDVLIGDGLRYIHSAPYVRAQVAAARLILSQCEARSTRNEDNEPVPGLVVMAAKGLSTNRP
jgi:predicted TPR repeat methyltransferase